MKKTVGQNVTEYRKSKGLTLEDLAGLVGSTKSNIWTIENKPNIRPSADLLYRIAVALDTTVECLLGENVNYDDHDQVFIRKYSKLKDASKRLIQRIINVIEE